MGTSSSGDERQDALPDRFREVLPSGDYAGQIVRKIDVKTASRGHGTNPGTSGLTWSRIS